MSIIRHLTSFHGVRYITDLLKHMHEKLFLGGNNALVMSQVSYHVLISQMELNNIKVTLFLQGENGSSI